MTAVPIPRQPYNKYGKNEYPGDVPETTPVVALKELVARLYKEQNKVQNLLSSLGFALRSFNNLNQFLELTPLMAARVTDAQGGALVLYKSNGQARLEQVYAQDNHISQQVRQILEEVVNKITRGKLQVEAIDEQIRLNLQQQLQIFSTPVLIKNVERGRLYVFSSEMDYLWTPTRRKLVQLVADQTGVAIANHELTLELRTKERQDRELEIASEIQLRLLPRKCPVIPGIELAAECQTASRVGGDYYDFIPTNYDQLRTPEKAEEEAAGVPWSVVIGDVMGKGVPAALLMTMTRGMLRAEVLNRSYSPAQIMQHLNRVMYADLENSHRFVTLFYSEYNPQTRVLSYTNAAHHPPLWWQAKTKTIEKLDTLGVLIGLDPDSEYEYATVELSQGDVIIYYTDGFTDAMNKQGQLFDEANLHRAFRNACENLNKPKEILDYLFEEVHNFIGLDHTNADDMTLVVLRVCS